MIFQIFVLYFASKLIGSHESIDRYGGYLPFATIGLATLTFFQTSFRSFAQAVRREQMTGTLESMLMTPTNVPAIVIGSSVWSIFWGMLQAGLYVICVSFLFDFELKGSLIMAGLLLGLMTVFVGSLGVISASFTIVFKRGDPLGFFVGTLSALVGGAVFPVSLLPSWMQKISYLHPFTYGLDGLRSTLLMGESLSSIATDMVVLVGSVCAIVPLSFFCFEKALSHARREGSLIQY
jgi:ABC-2 type transport system permease protein